MKLLKRLAFLLALALFIGIATFFYFNKKMPIGKSEPLADQLAIQLQANMNKDAYEATQYLKWTFAGKHTYVWDKTNNWVKVNYDNTEVLLNLAEWDKSKAFENGEEIPKESAYKFLDKAYSIFCNDSFWLVAPMKVFEEGVSRKVVNNEDGSNSLLITYGEGGVTPGDSYKWNFDKDGNVVDYNMWVSIIPIGGLSATWNQWTTTKTGLRLPSFHKIASKEISMEPIFAGNTLTEIEEPEALFNLFK